MKISCSENLIGCLIQSQNIAVKIVKKILETYLGLFQTAMKEFFAEIVNG